MKHQLKQSFEDVYGQGGELFYFFAPGRVNLIGEHIDYNGGFVFPCALDVGTYLVIRKTNDRIVKLASMNTDKRINVDLSKPISYIKDDGWANYPKGILAYFIDNSKALSGMEILYYGNIPSGAGLSSSASIEVVTAFALNTLFNAGYTLLDIAKLSQKVEREFIGVNCGIMDQFAVAFGEKDMAIQLNCDTLEYKYVPLHLDGYRIVICNTNKHRGLSGSKYNDRRSECELALLALQTEYEFEHLCECDRETFDSIKHIIQNTLLRKRAKHVIYENERVKEAVVALKEDNIIEFGRLMQQSHESLSKLYEVSCFELDVMVEEALKVDGTIGARMTGGGFGGCTVNIVKTESLDKFVEDVGRNYNQRTGLKADIYIAQAGDGVKQI